MKLKVKDIKPTRAEMLEQQGGVCPICELPIEDTGVLDHDHVTGHIRGVLHSGCNRLEGKAINWAYRTKGTDYPHMMENLANYWRRDYTDNPIHPTHRTEEEKRILRNERARKARAKRAKALKLKKVHKRITHVSK